jgi:hypothetical protein
MASFSRSRLRKLRKRWQNSANSQPTAHSEGLTKITGRYDLPAETGRQYPTRRSTLGINTDSKSSDASPRTLKNETEAGEI